MKTLNKSFYFVDIPTVGKGLKMKVNSGSSSSINRTQLSSTNSRGAVDNKSSHFEDRFDFSDIDPKARKYIELDEERVKIVNVLRLLLRKCLQLGLNIRYSKMKKFGEFILEARFEVKRTGLSIDTSMYLPVYLDSDIVAREYLFSNALIASRIETFINQALEQYDNFELIKIITVAAHEFGHFMSYVQGGHDSDLQRGLELMQRRIIQDEGKFTHLVFTEEVRAWYQAKLFLEKNNFEYWDIFTSVKRKSLEAYNSLLRLGSASLDVSIKLSFMDEYRNLYDKKLQKSG
jgi:hypothetical protein